MNNRFNLFLITAILSLSGLMAQDPHRFDADIQRFNNLPIPDAEELVVFTGSSSIRFWEEANQDCTNFTVVNTGFGGSEMSDLLYFLDDTVLRFNPSAVYIYEGDNDINSGKKPENIIETTRLVVDGIRKSDPEIEIYFIGAKPSPSRWHLKDKYLVFNTMLKSYCEKNPNLFYIDVWNPMLNEHGKPDPRIFISDSLHMNRKGYLIWKEAVCNSSN